MNLKNSITFEVDGTTPTAQLVESFLRACAEASNSQSQSVTVSLVFNLCSANVVLGGIARDQPLPQPAEEVVREVSKQPHIRVENIHAYWTHPANHGCKVSVVAQPQSFRFTLERNQGEEKFHQRLTDSMLGVFTPFDFAAAQISAFPAELAKFHEQQSRLFARERAEWHKAHAELREAMLQVQRDAEERRQKNDAAIADRQLQLDARIAEQTELLADDRRDFEQQKAEFDDRSRMHVRRQREIRLNEIIEKNRKLEHSPGTQEKRRLVHAVCLTTLAASITLYRIRPAKHTWSVTF
jgi:hypothetical protein